MVRGFGPLLSPNKFNTGEIADFAVDAVTNTTGEDLICGPPLDFTGDGDIEIQLEARAGGRYILQEGRGRLQAALRGLPLHMDHVGTEHPSFAAAVWHTSLIGRRD